MSDFKPFIISMASAGSGKTFTLVREYLRFALAGDEQFVDRNFRRILAITFTNKAANEMKVKLMEALDELADTGSGNKKSDVRDSLLQAINKMAAHQRQPLTEADLRRRATVLRSAILHRYSDLSVSTIDSFMHSIVRTFAHDLGRPVNFEVRIEQDDLIEMACGARDGTNGLDPEQKLQACAENIANLVFLFIRQAVRKPAPTDSWKDVIIKCRREITIIGLGIITLLVLRPQIADIVEHILRH